LKARRRKKTAHAVKRERKVGELQQHRMRHMINAAEAV
jgi:hypothetical protein